MIDYCAQDTIRYKFVVRKELSDMEIDEALGTLE